jgi:hypothetical protein
MRSAAGACLFGAILLVPRGGRADDREPVRVEFRAPAACPDEAAFFAQMQARTARVRRAAPGEDARVYDVTIVAEARGFVGRLVLHERARTSHARQVAASECADVIVALALIGALAVDPNADSAPIPLPPAPSGPPAPPAGTPPAATTSSAAAARSETPAASTPEASPVASAAGSEARATPEAAPSSAASARPGPVPGKERPAPRASSETAATEWLVGVAFDALAAGTGTAAPHLGGRVGVRWPSGFSVDATLGAATSQDAVAAGSAHLLWITASIAACPVRWHIVDALALAPCADVDAGALRVTGDGVPNPTAQTRPWFAAGGLARLELPVGELAMIDAQAGVAAPLVRDTFYFLPATDAFRPPAIVGWAGIGMGARFR